MYPLAERMGTFQAPLETGRDEPSSRDSAAQASRASCFLPASLRGSRPRECSRGGHGTRHPWFQATHPSARESGATTGHETVTKDVLWGVGAYGSTEGPPEAGGWSLVRRRCQGCVLKVQVRAGKWVPGRGNRMCGGAVTSKGRARPEDAERVRAPGAQETRRTEREALAGALWGSTAQVQGPASPLHSCVTWSKLLTFSEPQVLCLKGRCLPNRSGGAFEG